MELFIVPADFENLRVLPQKFFNFAPLYLVMLHAESRMNALNQLNDGCQSTRYALRQAEIIASLEIFWYAREQRSTAF